MIRFLTITFILGLSSNLLAQKDTSDNIPGLYPKWTMWVPGITHFQEGRILTGILFSTIEIGGITTGLIYDKELKKNTNTPYYNYPLLIGLTAFSVDKCDYFKNTLEYIKYKKPDFKYDDLPFNELMKSPFKPKNILTPITGTFVALALVQLIFESNNAEYKINQIDKFHIIDGYTNRNSALGFYGATSLFTSWGAGVSEEYIMRNFFMPVMDYRYGQKKGLIISSGVFGSLHAFNYFLVDKPDPLQILYHVSVTTIAGYLLGRNVQKNDYKIGQAISAHTWYNFTLMLGSFLVNPKENVFGVDFKIKI